MQQIEVGTALEPSLVAEEASGCDGARNATISASHSQRRSMASAFASGTFAMVTVSAHILRDHPAARITSSASGSGNPTNVGQGLQALPVPNTGLIVQSLWLMDRIGSADSTAHGSNAPAAGHDAGNTNLSVRKYLMSNQLDLSKELSGRRAVVTGGTRGIGAAITRTLGRTNAP